MTAKKDSPANLQEEFAPTLLFGDASQSALMPSVLRPQGGAFKGEL
jgi:hypothetical protein